MLRQLLMLAVVIGVVLSQNLEGRRGRGRIRANLNSPLSNQPVRIGRPRLADGNTRLGRPRQLGVPLPAPPPPPPPPTTEAPTPVEIPDYDYVYVDDAPQELLPNPLTPSQPVFNPEPVPVSRPPVFNPQPAPRRPSPQPDSRPAPRRPVGTLASIDRDFNLEEEQRVRGRKEPEVKILRSWSHQNADGTFSWGYVNTDGSFKNETRGLDCVVRGVYGYVDKDTGNDVSFPYESGNPCDPDAPDYYYDYDTNSMVVKDGESTVSRPVARPKPSRQG